MISHECKLVGFEPNNYQNKVLFTPRKWAVTVAHIRTRQQKDKWQKGRKVGCPLQTDNIFVVMDALGNVFEGEVLILHCHENGDCHEPNDRHSERSRVSELFQSADGCQSERSRVSSELHDRWSVPFGLILFLNCAVGR